MAWCEHCQRTVTDDELSGESHCPVCDEPIETHRPVPWHFKLMIVATVIYLGYRAFQGVEWLAHHA